MHASVCVPGHRHRCMCSTCLHTCTCTQTQSTAKQSVLHSQVSCLRVLHSSIFGQVIWCPLISWFSLPLFRKYSFLQNEISGFVNTLPGSMTNAFISTNKPGFLFIVLWSMWSSVFAAFWLGFILYLSTLVEGIYMHIIRSSLWGFDTCLKQC